LIIKSISAAKLAMVEIFKVSHKVATFMTTASNNRHVARDLSNNNNDNSNNNS